jgi:hypothetical protein
LLISITTIAVAIAFASDVAHAEKSFKYVFEVDDEGATKVMVHFWDNKSGSSWLYVPKDQRWMLNITAHEGRLLNVTYERIISDGREDPFYVVMKFHYEASTMFNASVEYRMKHGALIIEPRATFISPRIVHEGSKTNVVTYLPSYAITSEDNVSSTSGLISDVEVTREDGDRSRQRGGGVERQAGNRVHSPASGQDRKHNPRTYDFQDPSAVFWVRSRCLKSSK